MDKSTFARLSLLTLGTIIMLIFIIVVGWWVFNNRDKFGDVVLAPNTAVIPGTTKGTKAKFIDDTGVFPGTTVEYWVKEANATLASDEKQITWSVYLVKESPQMRKKGETASAKGAIVKIELRSSTVISLSAVVGDDGWISWTQSAPKEKTGLFIIDITGELPWAVEDKDIWRNLEVASYTPG